MPPNKSLWASWNFIRKTGSTKASPVSVSYYMNRLQKLKTKTPYIVTLNPQTEIDPQKIINQTVLTHPMYSFESMNSQKFLRERNGRRNTWLCGSYFGYGFVEDAVQSSVEIAHLGIQL